MQEKLPLYWAAVNNTNKQTVIVNSRNIFPSYIIGSTSSWSAKHCIYTYLSLSRKAYFRFIYLVLLSCKICMETGQVWSLFPGFFHINFEINHKTWSVLIVWKTDLFPQKNNETLYVSKSVSYLFVQILLGTFPGIETCLSILGNS